VLIVTRCNTRASAGHDFVLYCSDNTISWVAVWEICDKPATDYFPICGLGNVWQASYFPICRLGNIHVISLDPPNAASG
jgi:hypothetical protein